MKRTLAILFTVALILASCANSSGDDEGSPAASGGSSSASPSSSDDADDQTQGEDSLDPEDATTDSEGDDSGIVSALTNPNAAEFAEPLIPLDRILSGGPPPDGIPPIDDPIFIPAGEVDFLEDNQPVLAVTVGDETRAYPIQIMVWHEIVNDRFDGEPVTISYCPLCNTAIAYVGRLSDGTEVDFGTSGSLYNSSLVMYDRQTESLWTHFDGRAVVGTLIGEELEFIPMSTMGWGDFLEAFGPDAAVLSKETGFTRDYGRNPYVGYDNIDTNPFLFDGDLDGRLEAQTRVLAVRGDESVVITDELLAENRVTEFTLDGEDLVALYVSGTASALEAQEITESRDVGASGVFVPQIGGTEVQLSADDGDEEIFVDDLGNQYNIAGLVVAGPNEGEELERVEAINTFWFAISAFRPDSTIVS
jgi:Protein of unknown function (DUF3179)